MPASSVCLLSSAMRPHARRRLHAGFVHTREVNRLLGCSACLLLRCRPRVAVASLVHCPHLLFASFCPASACTPALSAVLLPARKRLAAKTHMSAAAPVSLPASCFPVLLLMHTARWSVVRACVPLVLERLCAQWSVRCPSQLPSSVTAAVPARCKCSCVTQPCHLRTRCGVSCGKVGLRCKVCRHVLCSCLLACMHVPALRLPAAPFTNRAPSTFLGLTSGHCLRSRVSQGDGGCGALVCLCMPVWHAACWDRWAAGPRRAACLLLAHPFQVPLMPCAPLRAGECAALVAPTGVCGRSAVPWLGLLPRSACMLCLHVLCPWVAGVGRHGPGVGGVGHCLCTVHCVCHPRSASHAAHCLSTPLSNLVAQLSKVMVACCPVVDCLPCCCLQHALLSAASCLLGRGRGRSVCVLLPTHLLTPGCGALDASRRCSPA
jgi:hypothetical protein